MATSTQITNKILASSNPKAFKQQMWERTRYLVAQQPASDDYADTLQGYYKGKVVVPGPLANPRVSETLSVFDLDIIEDQYFIRFTDNATTSSAEESVVKALYTIMSDNEANEYEAVLYKLQGKDPKDDRPEAVLS